MSAANNEGYLLLEDGTQLTGVLCAADEEAIGEVVFTTSMSGYQEAVTDPSFAGQIIVFTYPHIGNYGVSQRAMESERIHARAVVMRAAENNEDAPSSESGWLQWLNDCGVPAITGVDTRALVRHIRDQGAMRGGIFNAAKPVDQALAELHSEQPMQGRDLAASVTPQEVVSVGATNLGPTIAVIDTGIKNSIVENLRIRGARLRLFPCDSSAETILAEAPDAVFLANGPGDPAALDYIVDTVRKLLGKLPVFGICLGHQLLCRAVGLETYKLPFGHRGSNHPVKDLRSGKVEITSQNHGFAVLGPNGQKRLDTSEAVSWQTDFGTAQLTHINLYDRTVEGLELPEIKARTVQYHPEAGPGPHDSLYLFDEFIAALEGADTSA